MSRQLIAAGNWKMNKNYTDGLALTKAIAEGAPEQGPLVILGTPFIHLYAASQIVESAPLVQVAAQNCSNKASGAFTGETSVDMIDSVGATHVIIGHSERREIFGEENALLTEKVNITLEKGLLPIFCCGEPLSIREAETHVDYVKKQIEESLFHLSAEEFSKVVIAYEPIWAIGTGVTASPEQAQDMHWQIRQMIVAKYGNQIGDDTTILYGGSVKPANADALFGQPDVDGGLVGGASLKPDDFLQIIAALKNTMETVA